MTKITAPVPPGGPPPLRTVIIRDWSGGLNLGADDFQLPLNSTPDALDVDPSPLGGVERRASFRSLAASGLDTATKPKLLTYFQSNANANGIIVMGGQDSLGHDNISVWSGTDISDGHAKTAIHQFTADSTLGRTWSAASMKPVNGNENSIRLYIHRDYLSVVQPMQNDGTLATALGDAYGNYNEDLTAPAGGFMPKAVVMCAHLAYMFHATTYENSVIHHSRIRWSHPGQPEDYRANDYIDVGAGVSNDAIRALVSWGEALFIFKEHSVWVLTGYDANTFALTRLADNIGAANKNCAVAGANAVYFFDEFLGVHEIVRARTAQAGYMIQPLWNDLNAAIDDGRLDASTTSSAYGPCMDMAGSRLYISGVKWRSATSPNRTYVYDTAMRNGWWPYSVGFWLVCGFIDANGEKRIMGAAPFTNEGGASTTYLNFVCIQDYLSTDVDDRFNATNEVTYTGHIVTGWVDGGDAGMKKRFRRFNLVFDDMNASWTVLGYRNWSNTTPTPRTFTVAGSGDAAAADYGRQISKRGGALGSGFSAALKITGPATKAWALNSVTFRYVPRRIT